MALFQILKEMRKRKNNLDFSGVDRWVDKRLNYHLFQKFKSIGNDEFNHFIYII
jgi:hypothetical protein